MLSQPLTTSVIIGVNLAKMELGTPSAIPPSWLYNPIGSRPNG